MPSPAQFAGRRSRSQSSSSFVLQLVLERYPRRIRGTKDEHEDEEGNHPENRTLVKRVSPVEIPMQPKSLSVRLPAWPSQRKSVAK